MYFSLLERGQLPHGVDMVGWWLLHWHGGWLMVVAVTWWLVVGKREKMSEEEKINWSFTKMSLMLKLEYKK
jgi:hypothetical protein